MTVRLPSLLLLLTGLGIVFVYFFDLRFAIGEDEAIRRELRPVATTATLNAKVNAALDRNDVDEASMYAEIALYVERTPARRHDGAPCQCDDDEHHGRT